jgi:hypothetical protein
MDYSTHKNSYTILGKKKSSPSRRFENSIKACHDVIRCNRVAWINVLKPSGNFTCHQV